MYYTPEKGDIVWLKFTSQSGHEQKGRRPALIVSNTMFNKKTGMAIVCPITSTYRNYPLHVKIEDSLKISGYVMVEQIKSVDYDSRYVEFIEKASDKILNEVLSRLYACIY